MYHFELFISTVLLLVASNTDATVSNEGIHVAPSVDAVISSIKEAEQAGADVQTLVNNFNMALNFLDQADKSTFNSCYSQKDCQRKANKIFVMIIEDANSLKKQAATTMSFQKMTTLSVYAPITAFVTSIVGYFSFQVWKSYQVKKFMAMEIRKKQ